MRRIRLSRFETLAQRLVEGSFKRLFGGRLEPLEVAVRLARALEDSHVDGHAADLFIIHLHPNDFGSISQRDPKLEDELSDYVVQLAQQAGVPLRALPRVELKEDPDVARHQFWVQAEHSDASDRQTTQLFPRESTNDEVPSILQEVDAFLIIEDRQHYSLGQPLITLGRRVDNDIVLDSPTVSRQHAQLRWRYGRFVLYDLGGRGTTAVNGQSVVECALQPGDVISLSDVALIYGEGHETRGNKTHDVDEETGRTLLNPKS